MLKKNLKQVRNKMRNPTCQHMTSYELYKKKLKSLTKLCWLGEVGPIRGIGPNCFVYFFVHKNNILLSNFSYANEQR